MLEAREQGRGREEVPCRSPSRATMPLDLDLALALHGAAGGKSIEAQKRRVGVFDWSSGLCLRLDGILASSGGV